MHSRTQLTVYVNAQALRGLASRTWVPTAQMNHPKYPGCLMYLGCAFRGREKLCIEAARGDGELRAQHTLLYAELLSVTHARIVSQTPRLLLMICALNVYEFNFECPLLLPRLSQRASCLVSQQQQASVSASWAGTCTHLSCETHTHTHTHTRAHGSWSNKDSVRTQVTPPWKWHDSIQPPINKRAICEAPPAPFVEGCCWLQPVLPGYVRLYGIMGIYTVVVALGSSST